ncbi:hypothetical protein FKM82_024006 [Ascaphus truei]
MCPFPVPSVSADKENVWNMHINSFVPEVQKNRKELEKIILLFNSNNTADLLSEPTGNLPAPAPGETSTLSCIFHCTFGDLGW